ncbi:MAG TPA: hypothetical protein VGK98_18035 [Arthrobacter sp.]|uniref:hypothetical protein n=1 Tax=Arthrobacter sp. TaxID=1667 RepID=UPI002F3EB68A
MGGIALLKKIGQWNVPVFYAALIALMLGMFAWFFHHWLAEASFFFAWSVVCTVLVYRVVSESGRAFMVMLWTLFLNYITLLSIENVLGVPAAGPWIIGFIVGGIAGGYLWTGPRAGTEFKQPRKRVLEADGTFTGGRRIAVLNAACALVLLGIGTAQLVILSPTVFAVAVLVAAVIAGWVLFRFPLSLQIRNALIILGLPVVFFAFGFLGGATGQIALPYAWAYGVLAGILIGGRYWSGPRFGEPRPPFNGPGRRRRRKRRPKQKQSKQQTQKREEPAVGASHEH